MSNKYWFKSKKYGYGFTPVSWEGYLLIIFMLALILFAGYLNDLYQEEVTVKQGLAFLFDVFLITALSIPISKNKCQDKLGWRWGK